MFAITEQDNNNVMQYIVHCTLYSVKFTRVERFGFRWNEWIVTTFQSHEIISKKKTFQFLWAIDYIGSAVLIKDRTLAMVCKFSLLLNELRLNGKIIINFENLNVHVKNGAEQKYQ